jgi:hypothetical protein
MNFEHKLRPDVCRVPYPAKSVSGESLFITSVSDSDWIYAGPDTDPALLVNGNFVPYPVLEYSVIL